MADNNENEEDLTELAEKAKMLAKATGRDEGDVLADLMDDGVLNESNKKSEDLVSQLKEAAELISTVQAINKEVSENTVLNGGENKTEVEVNTTLEGDVVDRAIASAHRKVNELKKIALIIAPVFLLLTGGSMEAFGMINLFGSEDDDDEDMYYEDEYWGCTSWDAANYDPMANIDDGTCYWDDSPGEIRGCMDPGADNYDPMAEQDDGSCYYEPDPCENLQVIQTQDPSFRLIGESNNAEVIFYLKHDKGPECDGKVFVDVMISLYYNNGFQSTLDFGQGGSHSITANPQSQFEVRDGMLNGLGDGEWTVETRWRLGNGPENCCVMSDIIEIENDEPETECDAELINTNGELLSDEKGITMSADVYIDNEFNCDEYNFELYFRLYKDETFLEWQTTEPGIIMESDRGDYRFWDFEDLETGEYSLSMHLYLPDSPWHENGLVWEVFFDETIIVPDDTEPCNAAVHNHYRGHENNDPNSTTMIVAFYLEPDESCGTIDWKIELYQAGYSSNYTRSGSVSGGAESISQTFNDMAPGNWIPRITLEHEGVQVEQVQFWSLDIVEPEPTPCEINLYDIALGTNSTHATVAYDIDCGYGSETGGFNVSVQFSVYDVNGTSTGNGSGPITFETDLHYIEGYIQDIHTLILTNFTSSNATNYDFYWYAIWIDANGEQQFIEIKWLNRELNE